ncbi:hypothetical protein HMPREF9130_2056 [Peptoniphilus sp. oral taxon 375 str. F0436]|nr:hypothetical protein HMPREF9130_2056 [Peptoniphilus sp. oral taxon 375 str. F0436]
MTIVKGIVFCNNTYNHGKLLFSLFLFYPMILGIATEILLFCLIKTKG